MSGKIRISGAERKQKILEAAKPLFADYGFNGTSIRDIAKAADISNTLLYRHFASKEEIYEEILNYTDYIVLKVSKKLQELNPSTETLIFICYVLPRVILFHVSEKYQEQKRHERLLFYSLLENLKYARKNLNILHDSFEKVILDNFHSAMESGDIIKSRNNIKNRFWFMHHLTMGLNLCHVSGEPAFHYETSYEELVEDAALFILRGIGLTDKAIEKYYNSEKFDEMMENLF